MYNNRLITHNSNHDKRNSNSCTTNGMEESKEGKARVGDRTKGNIHAPGNIEDNINQIIVDTPMSIARINGSTAT